MIMNVYSEPFFNNFDRGKVLGKKGALPSRGKKSSVGSRPGGSRGWRPRPQVSWLVAETEWTDRSVVQVAVGERRDGKAQREQEAPPEGGQAAAEGASEKAAEGRGLSQAV